MIIHGKFDLVGRYCQRNQLPYEEFSTPGNYTFITKTLDQEFAYTHYGRAHAFLAKLEDVLVFGDGFILALDGSVMVHGLNHRNYLLDIDDYLVQNNPDSVVLSLPEVSAEIEEKSVLIWGNKNFGHWLFEHMPRTAVVARNPELKDASVVVTDNMPERFLDFLTATGIEPDRIKKYTPGSMIFFKELWVPSVVTYRGHYNDRNPYLWADSLFYLRHKILGEDATHSLPAKNVARRVYISRSSAQWRKPNNDAQVIDLLKKFDVEEVDMNGLPFNQQIDTVRNAELIVIAAGASSPITMYAPSQCVIIEFSPLNLAGTWGSLAWAHVMGQVFHRMACIADSASVDSNYNVDLSALEKNVHKALEYLHPKRDFFRELGV